MPSNPDKPRELRNISRIDKYNKTSKSWNHAWQVRFQRGGKYYSQWFEDSKYRGKDQALEEAQIFRDAMERELRPQETRPKGRPTDSPLPGVWLNRRESNTTQRFRPYWMASAPGKDGKDKLI